MADTSWLGKPPSQKLRIYTFLCGFQVFVYNNAPETETILKQLTAKQTEYDSLQKEIGRMEGIEYRESVNVNPVYDKRAETEIYRMLETLNGRKVVVIEECGC